MKGIVIVNKMKIKIIACPILFLLVFCLPSIAYAHGVNIEYGEAEGAIGIVVKYDSGETMAHAEVAVYAPDDRQTVWLTGQCDEDGRFAFFPKKSVWGTYDVQVRQAGHGEMIHIEISENGYVIGGGSSGYSTIQIVIMAVCVVWGIVGTALYFRRKRA